MKARRISWVGHVERMEDSIMPKRVMREKIYTRRKRGRIVQDAKAHLGL